MITVSWQQGNFRGYSVAQSNQFIIQGLQIWMNACLIRFGTIPHGYPANIRMYFYGGNMNGAFAAAYIETGQILITTQIHAPRDFIPMAIAHEVGHIIWRMGHVNRPEALMYTRGSTVRYFDHIEGQKAWAHFGKPAKHWPWSLSFVGPQVQAAKRTWEELDNEWESLKVEREAEKDKVKRAELNRRVLAKLAERNAAHTKLVTLNNQWLRIKSQWESVGGIRTASVEHSATGICDCFHHMGEQSEFSMAKHVDLQTVFDGLPDNQEPILGLPMVNE